MANRPTGYGLSGEIKRKMASKYDLEQEQEARLWIEDILRRPLNPDVSQNEALGPDQLHLALKDGVALCELVNAIHPGSVKRINGNSKMAFKRIENISNFLDACVALGVNKMDLFQTADLYDKGNMLQVVNGIYALGRKAQKIGFQGPTLGVKESDKNKRNFTSQQLNAGQSVIGLQMGSNKGASQAGMSFGRTRSINEHGHTAVEVKGENGSGNGNGSGHAQDDGSGYAQDDGSGYAQDDGSGYAQDDGSGYAQDDGSGYVQDDGSGYAQDDGSGYVQDDGNGNGSGNGDGTGYDDGDVDHNGGM